MNLCRVKQMRKENLSTDIYRLFSYYFVLIVLLFLSFRKVDFSTLIYRTVLLNFMHTFSYARAYFISLDNPYFCNNNVSDNFNSWRGKLIYIWASINKIKLQSYEIACYFSVWKERDITVYLVYISQPTVSSLYYYN